MLLWLCYVHILGELTINSKYAIKQAKVMAFLQQLHYCSAIKMPNVYFISLTAFLHYFLTITKLSIMSFLPHARVFPANSKRHSRFNPAENEIRCYVIYILEVG